MEYERKILAISKPPVHELDTSVTTTLERSQPSTERSTQLFVPEADLVRSGWAGHVALDGTKIKANASKHKAMSSEHMEKRAAELEAEVAKWLSAAVAADAAEDKLHGGDKAGEEMPDWIADKKRRAEKIREAKA
jgi:hypothetical protein